MLMVGLLSLVGDILGTKKTSAHYSEDWLWPWVFYCALLG